MFKLIILMLSLVFVSLPVLPVFACDNHAGDCEIEDWRYSYTKGLLLLEIDGVATCDKGMARIRLYENGEFVGTTEALIEGHTFSAFVTAVHGKPTTLEIKYSIETG